MRPEDVRSNQRVGQIDRRAGRDGACQELDEADCALGYALTSVMGPIVAEIFEGPHFGSIFGTITVALIGGGAAGPWFAGVIHDATGSYRLAFLLIIACCAVSAIAIWIAAPRKVRVVAGQLPRK